MFTKEEKQTIEQLRWKHNSQLETHIKPVEGGYVISTVERFMEGDVVVAQASFTKVATSGTDVADYVFILYTAEGDKEPVPTLKSVETVVGEQDKDIIG